MEKVTLIGLYKVNGCASAKPRDIFSIYRDGRNGKAATSIGFVLSQTHETLCSVVLTTAETMQLNAITFCPKSGSEGK